MWYIQTMEYSAINKERNNAICSNMDATRDHHPERERQIPCDIIYMWNLKQDTNEPIYWVGQKVHSGFSVRCYGKTRTFGQPSTKQKQTHRHREQTCGCQGGGGGEGKDWEFGISRCKLFYIGWINNKVLLSSTGNYIQYPVINHNGKEYEKKNINMCHSAAQQTLAQHCKSTVSTKKNFFKLRIPFNSHIPFKLWKIFQLMGKLLKYLLSSFTQAWRLPIYIYAHTYTNEIATEYIYLYL